MTPRELFTKDLNTSRFALQHGKRKLHLGDVRKVENYIWECYNYLSQSNPTDQQIKEFVKQHKDWFYLMVPNSKAGISLKQKLFSL